MDRDRVDAWVAGVDELLDGASRDPDVGPDAAQAALAERAEVALAAWHGFAEKARRPVSDPPVRQASGITWGRVAVLVLGCAAAETAFLLARLLGALWLLPVGVLVVVGLTVWASVVHAIDTPGLVRHRGVTTPDQLNGERGR